MLSGGGGAVGRLDRIVRSSSDSDSPVFVFEREAEPKPARGGDIDRKPGSSEGRRPRSGGGTDRGADRWAPELGGGERGGDEVGGAESIARGRGESGCGVSPRAVMDGMGGGVSPRSLISRGVSVAGPGSSGVTARPSEAAMMSRPRTESIAGSVARNAR